MPATTALGFSSGQCKALDACRSGARLGAPCPRGPPLDGTARPIRRSPRMENVGSGPNFVSDEKLVGERGFEPPAPTSRTWCSTRLSDSPKSGGRRLIAARLPPRNGSSCGELRQSRQGAGAGGFEPPYAGIKIRCLTAWRRPITEGADHTGSPCPFQRARKPKLWNAPPERWR
jgi:hypothetical protein